MRILYSLLLFCFLIAPVFAADEIHKDGAVFEGKITTISDGLIHIMSGGVEKSFSRLKNDDSFNDYIAYRTRPILGGVTQTSCKVIYVDYYYVAFITKDSHRVEIPRYRVSSLIINAN